MTQLNHSATLSIGARMSGSWTQSVGAVVGGTDKIKKEIARLKDEQRKLGDEGSAAFRKINSEIDAQRRKLANVKAWHALDVGGRTSGALERIGDGFAQVGRYAAYAGGAAFAGIGWFTKSALEAASSVEQMKTALTTTEGSSAKAERSMSWIKKFATETPYEMTQVGEAFTRLRAYGFDPMDGSLRTIGDAASSLGKDLMAGVEAFSDAAVGENERLKEFGIRAKVAGDKITYFYKNAAGNDVTKTVKKNSQAAIQATILAIWNEKYAGAMEKQSKTWLGLMSNLSDQWTNFQLTVMEDGVFNMLKSEAESLLTSVNKWANDGSLQRWAHEIGDAYRWAFRELREGFSWVRANWPEIKTSFLEGYKAAQNLASTLYRVGSWASKAAGGADNLAKGLLLLGAAKTLAPLGSLVKIGWDIVGWLSRATGLSAALEVHLSRAAMAAAGAHGMGARPALNAAGSVVGMGGAVATYGAGAIAGTVAAGAALGAGIGMGIDKLTEVATGKKLSTHAGEWMSSDVEARRRALLAGSSRRGAHVTHADNRVNNITVQVEAKGADAKEVAREVSAELDREFRAGKLAAH